MSGTVGAVGAVPAVGAGPTTVLAQAAGQGLPWFVVVPSVVMFTLVVITAPIWPYSRGWGWSIAGMGLVGTAVALLFTLAWVVS